MRDLGRCGCFAAVILAATLIPCRTHAAGSLEASPSSINHLPIDEEVNETLERVDKLIERKEWRQVIEICQKTIATPSKAVVEIAKGVYGSPRVLCEAKLRALPAPARLLYRTLYDPEAETLCRRARESRDEAAARRLVATLAMTSYGPEGMKLLGDMLFERGNAAGALRLWARWIEHVNAASLPEPARRRTAAKMAVAAAALGDRPAVERALKLFGDRGAVVEIGNARVARPAALAAVAAAAATESAAARPAPKTVDFVRWEAEFDDKYAKRMARYSGSSYQFTYACHGQFSGGVFFISTPEGPRAIDALTGRPVWQHPQRNYNAENYYYSFRTSHFHCRVVPAANGRVVLTSGGTRLGAYDAATGRSLWSKTRSSFRNLFGMGNNQPQSVCFSSPVLCHGPAAYTVLETTRSETYVLAMNRSDGSIRWCRAVGGTRPVSGPRVSFPSSLVAVGSELIFCTGHGIIGKCGMETGAVRWLVPYRRRTAYVQGNHYNIRSALKSAPIVVAGDSVVCAPSDGGELLAVQIADGAVQWTKGIGPMETFLGASASADAGPVRLFLGGNKIACLSGESGSILWTWPVPDKTPARGCITDAGVTVCTSRGLYVLDPSSGELTTLLQLDGRNGEPAGITTGPHSLAIVSGTRAVVIGSMTRTAQRLSESLRQTPNDPWSLAALARLRRHEGKRSEAVDRLAAAIRAARGRSGSAPLATELEREFIDLHDECYAAAWKAGRRLEAFQFLLRALHGPGRVPYECRLVRAARAETHMPPHVLWLASGDRIGGTLESVESGMITFTVRGEPWRIAADGVRRIILSEHSRADNAPARGDEHIERPNGDILGCRVLSLKNGKLRVRQRFAVPEILVIQTADVAAIAFAGRARKLPEDGVYLRLHGGDELSGVLRAFDGEAIVIDVPACGTHRIRVDDVQTISNRRRMPAPGTNESRRATRYGPNPTPRFPRQAVRPQ